MQALSFSNTNIWNKGGVGAVIPPDPEPSSDPFIVDFLTTAANETITLPISSGTINALIDWGDGSSDVITDTSAPELTHTYVVAGTQRVNMQGVIEIFKFNNSGDKLKIVDIVEWGDVSPTDYSDAFNGCSNMQITAIDSPPFALVNDASNMFKSCAIMTPNTVNWNTFGLTNMSGMFSLCTLFNGDVSNWDVEQCLSFALMFFGCSSFGGDVSAWRPLNVTTMTFMFFFVTINTTVYGSILENWSALAIQSGVDLHAGSSNYPASKQAFRDTLTVANSWTITDSGAV